MHSRVQQAVRSYQDENPGASTQDVIDALRGDDTVVQGEKLPVAVLDEAYRETFGTDTQAAHLSDETLLKQVVKRPGLSVSAYANVQSVIEDGQLIVKDEALHRVFVKRNGQFYYAVVKVTEDRSELYLQSFRRTRPKDIRRTKEEGEITKDELDLSTGTDT